MRYAVPKEMGIYKVIASPSDFNLSHIVNRIQENQKVFQAKLERKIKQEKEYYDNRYGKLKEEEREAANGSKTTSPKCQEIVRISS